MVKTCIILILCFIGFLFSQENSVVESYLDYLETDQDVVPEWLEKLWEFKENPLDVNRCSKDQFLQIPFLKNDQIEKLLRLRKQRHFKSWTDFQNRTKFAPELVDILKHFFTIKTIQRKISLTNRSYIDFNSPRSAGFERDLYHSAAVMTQKINMQYADKIFFRAIAAKDRGEKNWLDHNCASIKWQVVPQKIWLQVGSFQFRSGFGLLSWSPYGKLLSTNTPLSMSIYENAITAYNGSHENHYLQGAAGGVRIFKRVNLQYFYSARKYDATLDSTADIVTSIYQSGLHRTEAEKQKNDVLFERAAGVSLQLRTAHSQWRFSVLHKNYDLKISGQPKNQLFTSIENITCFSKLRSMLELAVFQQKFPAIQHLLSFAESGIRFQLGWYYFHPEYYSLSGRAFYAISQIPANQKGMLWQMVLPIWGRIQMSGFAHIFQKNRAQIFNDADQDFGAEIRYQKKPHQAYFRFTHKLRFDEMLTNHNFQKHTNRIKISYRYFIKPQFSLSSKIGIQWSDPVFSVSRFQGIFLSNAATVKLNSFLQCKLGWTSFDIPDYNLRSYIYEPDIPGRLKIVLLNNEGHKYFVIFSAQFWKSIRLYFKWRQIIYPNLQEIGSGLAQTSGNRRNEIRAAFFYTIK